MKIATGFAIVAVLALSSVARAGGDTECLKRLESEHRKMSEQEKEKICAAHGSGSQGNLPAAPAAPASPAPAKPVIGYDVKANKSS